MASGNLATARTLLDSLGRPRGALPAVHARRPGPAAEREGVILETPFVGPGMRDAGERLDYLPMRLSLVPRLFATIRPPDVVLLHTSTPREGRSRSGSRSTSSPRQSKRCVHAAAWSSPRLNPRMPYTLGDSELAEDLIDLAIEVEEELASPARGRVTRARRADRRARRGASSRTARRCSWASARSPTRPCARSGSRRDLAIWSEMISDGVMELERGWALDRARPIVCSFLFGSPELYRGSIRTPG